MNQTVRNRLIRARCFMRSALGRDVFLRAQIREPYAMLGGHGISNNGAWGLRLDSLTEDSIVYSFGVGDDISFDRALIERKGVTIHAFDPTPRTHEWLKGQSVPDGFILHKYAVGDHDGTADFFPPQNEQWISHSMLEASHTSGEAITVPVRRLSTLMTELGHDHVDVLKLDIEGAEYSVLADLVASGIDVGQILVEFHHRFSTLKPADTRQAIDGLVGAGYRSFYVSADGEEYGFLKR